MQYSSLNIIYDHRFGYDYLKLILNNNNKTFVLYRSYNYDHQAISFTKYIGNYINKKSETENEIFQLTLNCKKIFYLDDEKDFDKVVDKYETDAEIYHEAINRFLKKCTIKIDASINEEKINKKIGMLMNKKNNPNYIETEYCIFDCKHLHQIKLLRNDD